MKVWWSFKNRFLLILVSILCLAPNSSVPDVEPLGMGRSPIPEALQDFFEKVGQPIEPSLRPELPAVINNVEGLLRSIILPSDAANGTNKIYFTIVDQPQVMASFQKIDSHRSVITMSLGLLRFVRNTDELAFVLGHEVEHGASEIEEYIRKTKFDSVQKIFSSALQRAVENEVDVKSTIRRVHEAGLVPYAGIHVMNRFRSELKNDGGLTHTTSSSRADTISAAVVALRRVLGEQVKEDIPENYRNEILRGLQDNFLGTPEYRERQLRLIEATLKIEGNPATKIYEDVKKGISATDELGNRTSYSPMFEKYWDQIKIRTGDLFTTQELIDFQIRLHQVLQSKFERARSEVLGENWSPKTIDQRDALLTAENRYYSVTPSDPADVQRKMIELERELAGFRHRNDPESRSRTIQISRQLEGLSQEFWAIKHAYDPSMSNREFEVLVEEVNRWVHTNYTGMDNSNYLTAKAALRSRLRVIPEYEQVSRSRVREIETSGIDLVVGSFRDVKTLEESYGLQGRIGQLRAFPEEVVNGRLGEVFENLRLAFFDRASTYTPESEYHAAQGILGRFSNHDTPLRKLWMTWREVDSTQPDRWLKSLYKHLIGRAQTLAEVEYLLEGVALEGGKWGDKVSHFSSTFGFKPMKSYAKVLLSSDVVELYFDRYLDMLEHEIKNPAPVAHEGRYGERVRTTQDRIFTFLSRVTQLEELGILPEGFITSPLLHRGINKISAALSENSRSILLAHVGAPLTELEVRTFSVLQNPGLIKVLKKQGRWNPDSIQRGLETLSKKITTPIADSQRIMFYSAAYHLQRAGVDPFPILTSASPLVDFKAVDVTLNQDARTELMDLQLDFVRWLERNSPNRHDLRWQAIYSSHWASFVEDQSKNERLIRLRESYIRDRFKYHFEKSSNTEIGAQIERATYSFWKEAEALHIGYFRGDEIRVIESYLERSLKLDPIARAEAVNGYFRGVRRVDSENRSLGSLSNGGHVDFGQNRYSSEWILAYSDPSTTKVLSDVAVGELASHSLWIVGRTEKSDEIFEEFWKRSDGNSELRAKFFSNPEIVSKFFYDLNKKRAALWQLEYKFGLNGIHAAVVSDRKKIPRRGQVRGVVRDVVEFINLQFPKKSALSNDIIDYVQEKLVTNATETTLLDQQKLLLENWYQSRKLALLDAPQLLSRGMKSGFDRLELVEYLIGTREEFPRALHRMNFHSPEERDKAERGLRAAKREFFSSDIVTRTHVMQSLLDYQQGILSESESTDRMFHLILGDHKRTPIIEKLFSAYLGALSESEKKVVLSYILASFADSKAKKVSIRTILEAMGPFGIKAGQFIRTSGLASPEIRTELDNFLDRALKPNRREIMKKFREIFGRNFRGVAAVRQLAGSGSINYVVAADIYNPDTRKVERVAVRIRRDFIEGLTANENRNWARAIQTLSFDSDPEVVRFSGLLEEARLHAYRSLGEGGPELDLSLERDLFPRARHAYAQDGIRVATPVDGIQKLVPENMQKMVSVYEYVEHTVFRELPAETQKSLARQIVQAELNAMFIKRTFDPDAHPGNWLYDSELVRIDYNQMVHVSPQEKNAFKSLLTSLVQPRIGEAQVSEIVNIFNIIFEVEGGSTETLEQKVKHIVGMNDFPDFRSPHERLFFMRQKLEELLGGSAKVRLREGPRSMFFLFSRLQIYKEYLGPEEFSRILLSSLGTSIESIKVDAVKEIVRSKVRQRLRLARERSVRVFSSIGNCLRDAAARILRGTN